MELLERTRLFVKVVQNGSFSRAAELLRIPKSTVSKAVSQLERETGTKLLLRTTRSLTLTAAGRAFFDTCLGPLQTLEDAQKSLVGSDSILSGHVKLTAPEDLGTTVIAPVIGELSLKHPELSFELYYTDEVVDLVKDGYDLAVRIGRLRESSLRFRKVGEVVLVPVVAPRYLKAMEGKISEPKDLEKFNCLNLTTRSGGMTVKWNLRSKSGWTASVSPTVRVVSNQMSSLLRMAIAGAGVALVPSYLARADIEAGRLVRVLPAWSAPGMPVQIVSPLASTASARLRLVSEKLAAAIERALGSAE